MAESGLAPSRSHWQLVRQLLHPHRRELAWFGLVLALATALPLAGPLILRANIDGATSGESTRRLALLGEVYALPGLAAAGAQVVVSWRATTLTWRVTNEFRNEVADHALHADRAFSAPRLPASSSRVSMAISRR